MGIHSVDQYREIIASIAFVKNLRINCLENNEIVGDFEVEVNKSTTLPFSLKIFPSYPYKLGNNESIKFFNQDLISYKHVMCDGSICIHTVHGTNLEKKLNDDFDSLRNWIQKYYIDHETETHYEHVINTQPTLISSTNAFLFTDVEHEFKPNQFGEVNLSKIENGFAFESIVNNFIVKSFSIDGIELKNQWSESYCSHETNFKSVYIYLEKAPTLHNKFLITSWEELLNMFPYEFITLLNDFKNKPLIANTFIPLLIGYKTTAQNTHWQVALLNVITMPFEDVPILCNVSNKFKWELRPSDEKINWCITQNCSPHLFFGRGILHESIIEKKVLIIGVGAVGSILATTLTRCGAKYLDFIDYDIKEQENVCRSEYEFIKGVGNKTDELRRKLISISPFIDVKILLPRFLEVEIKSLANLEKCKKFYSKCLSNYDIIFDCTTDDDLMHILNDLEIQSEIWNLSITNHAKEMVVGLHPNIYNFVTNQFNLILENDSMDLYNPTGCWNPTFKANYNDINLLVQTALKQINLYHKENIEKRCFTIHTSNYNSFKLEIKQY